jgi:hypothetical protein
MIRRMHDSAPERSLLAAAIEIPAWLEADRETPYDERLHRDRAIAGEVKRSDPLLRVREWWRRIHGHAVADSTPTPAARLVRAQRLITVLMGILGAVAGLGAASAIFHYDGTWPVNVVTVFATLVLLQLLLILLTLLLMLPRAPGIGAIQDLIGSLNPGAFIAALYRRVARMDDRQANLLLWHEARAPAAARFARWQMVTWSQVAAVAFNAAVLATAIGLIAFTDLAFGWSTTLRLDANDAFRITDALAAPWRPLWPAATPDPELIRSSRFFRLAAASPNVVPPADLTGWWPFLLAAIVTYGLLPRCLLLTWASWRLHVATRHLLLDDPQVRALLDRMNSTEIRLGTAAGERVHSSHIAEPPLPPLSDADAIAIAWSGAIPRDTVSHWIAQHLHRRVAEAFNAGNGTLAADEATLDRIAARNPSTVFILVRAWEAPLLELKDFIGAVREHVGAQCSIVIVPVAADRDLATAAQRATWSRWTARHGDAAVYLESGA